MTMQVTLCSVVAINVYLF